MEKVVFVDVYDVEGLARDPTVRTFDLPSNSKKRDAMNRMTPKQY